MAISSYRWLLAAALVAPLAAAAQVLPGTTSTSVSTSTTVTTPGVPNVAGAVGTAAGAATGTMGTATRVATGAAHMATAYHAAPPEQRAARMAQQLATELHLDAATTAKVQAAALVRAQSIDAIQTGTATNKEKNTALVANAQQFKSTLQGILTPAQYTQYLSKMAKAKVAAGASADVSGE